MYTTNMPLNTALNILEAVGGNPKDVYLYRTGDRFVFDGFVAISVIEAIHYVNQLSLYELNKTANRSTELNELDANDSS